MEFQFFGTLTHQGFGSPPSPCLLPPPLPSLHLSSPLAFPITPSPGVCSSVKVGVEMGGGCHLSL